MENVSLILFTLCLQFSVGIALAAGIAGVVNKESKYTLALIVAAVLAIIGTLASLIHLGKPLSFMNSLSQFGDSWLTKEVWFAGIFTGVIVIAAVVAVLKKRMIAMILALVAAAIGLFEIFAMVSSYSFSSVPAWQSEALYIDFYAVALTAGIAVYLLLGGQEALKLQKWFGIVIVIVIALQVAFNVYYLTMLGASSSAAAAASMGQLAELWPANLIKWLSLIIGAFLIVCPSKESATLIGKIPLICGVILLVVGQVLSRCLFYAVMVINSVGLP
jgi:anaerobic dimethyl sulfoxide reductase subunit C (anchor subunit)